MQNYMQEYVRATTRLQKSIVVSNVLKQVTKSGGRFIKSDKSTKQWYQMTPEQAHDKTGHAIRDFIRQQEKENAKRMSIKAITNTLQGRNRNRQSISIEPLQELFIGNIMPSKVSINQCNGVLQRSIKEVSDNCCSIDGCWNGIKDLDNKYPDTDINFSPDLFIW
jgi:hypothetical protein